jgi:predicted transcriptional regulator
MSNDLKQNEDGSFTCAMKVSESREMGSEPPIAEFAMPAPSRGSGPGPLNVLSCTYRVTHEGKMMTEATFTFRVDEDLKALFTEAAKARDRTGAQLLRDFMRDYVRRQQEEIAHEAWFRAEVEQAIREADDPSTEWVPHEVVKQDVARERAELLARIKNEAE